MLNAAKLTLSRVRSAREVMQSTWILTISIPDMMSALTMAAPPEFNLSARASNSLKKLHDIWTPTVAKETLLDYVNGRSIKTTKVRSNR